MKLNLGNQIRMNRRRMDLTQEQLAEEFGTSPQAISRWENGTTYPDIEMLPMIASFFGTTVDSLLGRTEEEKEEFCRELQGEFEAAARAKDSERVIDLLRKIRQNLREYQSYWFWELYHEIWRARLFRTEKVLEEMRLLAEAIFQLCPRETHYDVIAEMANMEDDEHIDAFLDAYAGREDVGRMRLLFNRYKMREEMAKIEPVRQFNLWYELSGIIDAPNDWQEYLCEDSAHWKWYCETQLNYLNAVNCLYPDKKHIVSGGGDVDLWCSERLHLGIRLTASHAKLGDMDAAYDAFEDTVSLLEQIMAIKDDKFALGCSSPSLKTFSMNAQFHWMKEQDGKEHRQLMLDHKGWNTWVIPIHYKEATGFEWFVSMKEDDRFAPLFERLEKCVVTREENED